MNPLDIVENQFKLLNRSILMSELGVRPKLQFWTQMSSKQTQKIRLQGIKLLSSQTPLEIVKNHVRLLNRSILMSKIGVSSKLRCWAMMSMKQTRKIELQRI